MTFREELRGFVQQHLVREGQHPVGPDDESLITRGVIDSLGLLQLVLFIEERTGVKVPDEDVLPDNFDSISSVDRMVDRLRR